MSRELYTYTPFDPNPKWALPFDYLDRMISRTHRVVAEHWNKGQEDVRLWEIRCEQCFHAYWLTTTQIEKLGAQPCRCDRRSGR